MNKELRAKDLKVGRYYLESHKREILDLFLIKKIVYSKNVIEITVDGFLPFLYSDSTFEFSVNFTFKRTRLIESEEELTMLMLGKQENL